MKAIDYPKDLEQFKSSYIDVFKAIPCSQEYRENWLVSSLYKTWKTEPEKDKPTRLIEMEDAWKSIKRKYFQQDDSNSPMYINQNINGLTVEGILVAPFQKLADIYYWFVNLKRDSDYDSLIKDLKSVFTYDTSMAKGIGGHVFVDSIAGFFIEHAEELNISVCPYCELSYVSIINRAYKQYRTFDLDHFFCKSDCPITALSLFNFVPSCQICNQKMKHNSNLFEKETRKAGKIKFELDSTVGVERWRKVSPTNPEEYKFDEKVHIRYVPRTEESKPSIFFACDCGEEDYQEVIKLFGLNERYSFHYKEAERIINLKKRYPDSHIRKMVEYFNSKDILLTFEQIREDIHGIKFRKECNRIMAKMYKDIYENN